MSLKALVALGTIACAACSIDWRTDMWFQPGGGLHSIARPEPEGSVPLDARPHFDDRDEAEGFKEAFPGGAGIAFDGAERRAEPSAAAASVARGRTLFVERCASCHGSEGHGGGPVGKFFPPAPDLGYPVIQAHPDGYLYATLLLGGRAMPIVREGLSQTDLWDLVHFVRTIKPKAAP